MRLFISISCEALNEYFLGVQKQLQGNLAFARSFHITLKFLGEVKEEMLPEIISAIEKIKFSRFSFETDKIGIFDNEQNIKVIWLGIEPKEEIISLQKQIEKSLKEVYPNEKNFVPHITLARVKYIEDKDKFLNSLKKIKVKNNLIHANSFSLMKSNLTNVGPVYEEVKRFELE